MANAVRPMLTHAQIWMAIDRLAARAGLSASGLAKKAGLDPTTFNKSKRITADGRARWPSTESVAKSLDATATSIETFVALIHDGAQPATQSVPLIGLAEAGARGVFDDAGLPAGKGWQETALPAIADPHAYALEISGNSCEPVYRKGDVAVVSPAAAIRRGDRVVIKTKDGEVTIGQLARKSSKAVELQPFDPALPGRNLATADVMWIARIVWVKQ